MAFGKVETLTDVVGKWRTVQKLIFIFVQFSSGMYGWFSLELVFLVPDVKIYCDVQDYNFTNISACSSECPSIRYEHVEFKTTLTEQLGLVCGLSWLKSFSFTLMMLSAMIGNLVSGELADRLGRRRTVLLCPLPFLLGSLLVLFPQNYYVFAVGLCLIGITYLSMTSISYLLLFELCGQRQRSILGVSLNIGFSFVSSLLGALAWSFRDWFHLHLVGTCLLAIFAFSGLLPESPEWLIKRGRTDEAAETIRRIISVNRKPKLSDSEIRDAVTQLSERYKAESSNQGNTSSIVELFVSSKYRMKILGSCYIWFAIGIVFYGISINVKVFGEHMFLSFILSSLSSIPCIIILMVLLKFINIKNILIGISSLGTLLCYLYIIEQVLPVFRTIDIVLGWCFGVTSLVLLYPYTAQMFPTEVRGKAFGLSSFMGRVGGSLAPFAKELASATKDYVPMLIFGALYTIMVVLVIKLPSETPQPKTTDEERERGQDNSTVVDANDVTPKNVANACDSCTTERF